MLKKTFIALSVFMLWSCVLAAGEESQRRGVFYVSPTGNDAAAGSLEKPWRTVNAALKRLRPGDTLYLRSGTYYERVQAALSGVDGAPITIASFPGETAVLDSGAPDFRTPGNSDWELVNAEIGEYRSVSSYPRSGYIFAYVVNISGYENERVVLIPYQSASAFRARTDVYVDKSTPFYAGPGTFWDPQDGRIHIRLSKTADMRAAESRYGMVFSCDNDDPRRHSIVLSKVRHTLIIEGAHLIIKNITFHQAQETIYLAPSARNVRLEGITAWLGDRAIAADGASSITITRSRIYGDAPYWIYWSDMKNPPAPADLLRSTSVELFGGAHDVEISYSHIRGSGQDLIGVNEHEYNLTVHHCRIENCGDDAFELEGTQNVGKISIFENYIGNALVAVAPGQDTVRFDGPLCVYRNVVCLLRNPPINRKEGINRWNGGLRYGYEYMFKHGTGSSYSTRNAHYYHNTLVMLSTAGVGMNITPKDPRDTRIANNLLVMVNGTVNRDYRTGTGQVVDGNLYWKMNGHDLAPLLSRYDSVPAFSAATGLEKNGIGSEPRQGTDPRFAAFKVAVVASSQSSWEVRPDSEVFGPGDFLLAKDSPAIGKGIAIPPHPDLGVLPDTRHSLDIGALPYGTSAAEYAIFPFVPYGADVEKPSTPKTESRLTSAN